MLAFEQVEPLERTDYQLALLASILLNVHRGKGDKAISLQDCLLKFSEEEVKHDKRAKVLAWIRSGKAK